MASSWMMLSAVTRTCAVPTVFSLCSSTCASPAASAVTVSARALDCPLAIRIPADVSKVNVRCWSGSGRLSLAVITALEKPSAGSVERLAETSNTSSRASARNATEDARRIEPAATSICAVAGDDGAPQLCHGPPRVVGRNRDRQAFATAGDQCAGCRREGHVSLVGVSPRIELSGDRRSRYSICRNGRRRHGDVQHLIDLAGAQEIVLRPVTRRSHRRKRQPAGDGSHRKILPTSTSNEKETYHVVATSFAVIKGFGSDSRKTSAPPPARIEEVSL